MKTERGEEMGILEAAASVALEDFERKSGRWMAELVTLTTSSEAMRTLAAEMWRGITRPYSPMCYSYGDRRQ